MRRNAGWISLLLGLCLPWAASAEVIQLTVQVPEPRIWVDERGYSHVEIPGYIDVAQTGSPLLPSRSVMVGLPPSSVPIDIQVHATQSVVIPGEHAVVPAQRPRPLSFKGPIPFDEPDPIAYGTKGPVPAQMHLPAGLQFVRGFSVLPVRIQPVQYFPETSRLIYSPELVIEVVTAPSRQPLPANPLALRGLSRDVEWVRGLLDNPDMVDSYSSIDRTSRAPGYRYVIITNTSLSQCSGQNNLQTLLADKESRGLTTLLKTVSEIRDAYSGHDDQEKIRNFIKDMYENQGTDFVLIAGDADGVSNGNESQLPIVPVRKLWGDIGSDMGADEIPSDLYYAALDGNFNADGDGEWGDEDDDADLLAEVWIGRAPVDNCTEVYNFVRKTLTYQNSTDAYLRDVVMVGEWLWDGDLDNWGRDYLERIRNSSTDNGLDTKGFSESNFFVVSDLYDYPQADSWDKFDIMAVLNAEPHIVNHLGHSYTHYNMRMMTTDIDSGMTNDLPFFEYSQGCYCGSFDNRYGDEAEREYEVVDSFAEHMTLGSKGAFAVIMNTRYGLGGYSNYFHRLFWDALFRNDMNRLGEMHTYSKDQLSAYVELDTGMRWVYYEATLFGDPEVAVHVNSGAVDPVIGLPAEAPYFLAIAGLDNPADKTISIQNNGGGSLNWTVSCDQDWLTFSPESGTAPSELTMHVDASGLDAGTYTATLTFSAPGATNSPQQMAIELYLIEVPVALAPEASAGPVVDGVIDEGEYDEGEVLLMDPWNEEPIALAAVMHQGGNLYMAFDIGTDTDEHNYDALDIYIDSNADGEWPTAPGSEGAVMLYATGQSFFSAFYNAGSGLEYTDADEDHVLLNGVQHAFGFQNGHRVLEVAFDLSNSPITGSAGDSFGLFLIFSDYVAASEDWEIAAYYPWALQNLDNAAYLSKVTLATATDQLKVNPESMHFSMVTDTGISEKKLLTISSTTANQLGFTLQTSETWLRASSTNATTPSVITVWADSTGLTPGTYNAQVTVTCAEAENSPVSVPVAFDVLPTPPQFDVAPGHLSFDYVQGSPTPNGQSLTITNAGGGDLQWSVVTSGTWIQLSANSGTAPGTITVTPVVTGLPAGFHAGSLLFQAPGAQDFRVDVGLNVSVSPHIGTDPVSVRVIANNETDPVKAEIWIRNTQMGNMAWTLADNAQWLTATPESGTYVTGHPMKVTLTFDPAGLAEGSHNTEIGITAPGADNSPLIIPITFVMPGEPALSVLPTSLDFTGVASGNQPEARTLLVANDGYGSLDWTATVESGEWFAVDLTSGTVTLEDADTVTITPDITELRAGTHSGSIRFTAEGVPDVQVSLSLVLSSAPSMAVDAESLEFVAHMLSASPDNQTINVTNAGGGSMTIAVDCQPSWLVCAPSNGPAPLTVQVGVNHTGMDVGAYTGKVTISSVDADNGPLVVDVDLEVLPANSPPPVPEMVSPEHGAEVNDPKPELVARAVTDPEGDAVTYTFQVFRLESEDPFVTLGPIEADGDRVSVRVDRDLVSGWAYEWRVRAEDEYGQTSEYSEKRLFNVIEKKGGGCASAGGPGSGGLWLLLFGLVWLGRHRGCASRSRQRRQLGPSGLSNSSSL